MRTVRWFLILAVLGVALERLYTFLAEQHRQAMNGIEEQKQAKTNEEKRKDEQFAHDFELGKKLDSFIRSTSIKAHRKEEIVELDL